MLPFLSEVRARCLSTRMAHRCHSNTLEQRSHAPLQQLLAVVAYDGCFRRIFDHLLWRTPAPILSASVAEQLGVLSVMGATWVNPNEDRAHHGLVESLACYDQLMRNAVF
jgi:hypothetical protein